MQVLRVSPGTIVSLRDPLFYKKSTLQVGSRGVPEEHD
jgi:hypothetical protein